MARKKVVIDTDPGVDDVLALLLAFRSGALDVRAITAVAGNVSLQAATNNALRVLEQLDLSDPPPVHAGCSEALGGELARAPMVHGEDGIGGASASYSLKHLKAADSHAAEAILEAVRSAPGEVTVIALGPMTNVATAIEVDAESMALAAGIVVMGGSLGGYGNVTPAAEFNFFADPVAARIVVQSGLPVTLVGLNVTQQAAISREDFEQLAAQTPWPEFLIDVTRQYFQFSRERRKLDGCYLHDPLAVGVVIDDSFIETKHYPCDVETEGDLTAGSLVVDQRREAPPDGSNVHIATQVDADRFIDYFRTTLAQ